MGARNRHRLEHCSICALRGAVTQSAAEPPCRCHCEASISLCPFLDPAFSIGGMDAVFFSSSSLLSLSLYGRPPSFPSISSVICARLPQARGKPKRKRKKKRDKRDHKANGTTSNWLGSQWLFVTQAQWREKRCAVPVAVHPRGGGVSLSLCLFLAKSRACICVDGCTSYVTLVWTGKPTIQN